MSNGTKLMVISQGLAPMVFGGTILLNNLLTDYPGDAVGVAGPITQGFSDPNFKPATKTYYHNLSQHKLYKDYYTKLIEKFPFLLASYFNSKIKKEKPTAIMAPVPEVFYFIEAYKAAKRHNLPFYAHMHDLWQENYATGTPKRILADKWEREILTNARRVFCMNDVQKEHYEKKYGIKCYLLPHTITREALKNAPKEITASDKQTVLFTGTISGHMNIDALKVISRASSMMGKDHIFLCCTPSKKEHLESLGISSPHMQVKYVSRTEVQEIQNKAAILIAPLSHKNASMDEVRTVFSTKILEYLISGRPILIFAPKDSFHAISARKNGWAYVVDEDSPEALVKGMEDMLSNESLCATLVQNALKEAHNRLAEPFSKELYNFVVSDSK